MIPGDEVPVIVPVAVGFSRTETDEDGRLRFVCYLRELPRERIRIVDCLVMRHNQGTVPGLLPPVPDGWVEYSVWVEWRRGAARWSRRLYTTTVVSYSEDEPELFLPGVVVAVTKSRQD